MRLLQLPGDGSTFLDAGGKARCLGPTSGPDKHPTRYAHAVMPGDVVCAILTDATFRAPATALTTAQARVESPVHTYEFAWRTTVLSFGACHALELPFVFDTLDNGSLMTGDSAPQRLADEVHRAWVAFARGGDPRWPQWSPDNPAVMTFDESSAVVHGPRADELALWTAPHPADQKTV